ncbi:hypothetical protein [Nonomuraea wenchangensis]|uniref:Uncharacterized protein n=1 Tax=Nonomuraea wenchangensis TaxID=568860 RepID=A0A1I0LHW7_9ACTN|nr:hypothetical protein [Nonomuraea wenchangensis]SEU39745.1 hypothetical protein SAMN05421811_11775 [Nonomuraea wenchangensis]
MLTPQLRAGRKTSTVEIPPRRGDLFAHGTGVILMEPADDLTQQATILLREYGPVHSGTPAGDFNVIDLDDASGWAVTGHHPDILTYLDPSELENHDYLAVGILGRAKRDRDGNELTVLHHLEDKRSI